MARGIAASVSLHLSKAGTLIALCGCMALASCTAARIEAPGAIARSGIPSKPCGLSQADQAWLDQALGAWDRALATAAETAHPPQIQAIIFDQDCTLTSRTAMSGGEKVWSSEPHNGEVLLPHGSALPVQIVSFAAPAPGGAFFVMAAPSIWQTGGVQSAELGLEQLMTAVLIHEAAHVLQFPTYGSRISLLADVHDLPADFSDDSIQERFELEEEFASSIARETELLLGAADAVDLTDAVGLAREARLLAQARHDRWFSGELAYLKEAEDVWLTLEGSAQWLGYRWLMDRSGGARSPEEAANGFGLRGRWWSQRHGFALFAALERLQGAEWKKHAFGDGAKTAGEMLDQALHELD